MIEHGEHERRPFFVCESCNLVFARAEEPAECVICDSQLFTEVMPQEVAQ